jgi:hypothetical protein
VPRQSRLTLSPVRPESGAIHGQRSAIRGSSMRGS